MGRRRRVDHPGMVFHVMNRAIAHRPAFDRRADVRFFLALVARATRRWGIEVQAYSVLTTHFHLLVRSTTSELSRALGWIEQRFTVRFNRTHGRDGPLFRGRFVARHVDCRSYWFAVVKYIDRNAVAAGLVGVAGAYPYCSARQYRQAAGPPWLARAEVEATVRQVRGTPRYRAEDYAEVFGDPHEAETWLVERHLACDRPPALILASLLAAAPPTVREWLAANIRNADGTIPKRVLVAPRALLAAITGDVEDILLLRVGLLRECCGLRLEEVAPMLGISASTVRRREVQHRDRLRDDAGYARRVAEVVAKACLAPICSTSPPS